MAACEQGVLCSAVALSASVCIYLPLLPIDTTTVRCYDNRVGIVSPVFWLEQTGRATFLPTGHKKQNS
jgi:hypothetical protein